MPAVDVRNLRREFRGKRSEVIALDYANLQVEAGEIFGLLGPNGAGKTTLIRYTPHLSYRMKGFIVRKTM